MTKPWTMRRGWPREPERPRQTPAPARMIADPGTAGQETPGTLARRRRRAGSPRRARSTTAASSRAPFFRRVDPPVARRDRPPVPAGDHAQPPADVEGARGVAGPHAGNAGSPWIRGHARGRRRGARDVARLEEAFRCGCPAARRVHTGATRNGAVGLRGRTQGLGRQAARASGPDGSGRGRGACGHTGLFRNGAVLVLGLGACYIANHGQHGQQS
jgi:hypothetical protein